MSEMIERVARALCKEEGYDPDDIDQLALAVGLHGEKRKKFIRESADRNWMCYQEQARTAIEAMREPTEEMRAAASDGHEFSKFDAERVWRKMIDEMLK